MNPADVIPSHVLDAGQWLMEGLYVTIKDIHDDERFHDREGVITAVNDGRCAIYVADLDRSATADFDQILPVKPEEGEPTRVIYGEELGATGTLVSIEESAAILKVNDSDMRLIPNGMCCKMRNQ